jgi:hypothetical protein
MQPPATLQSVDDVTYADLLEALPFYKSNAARK